MESISTVLTQDHRHGDELFARVEETVANGEVARAGEGFAEFARAMTRHFQVEEETLFPALEAATGSRHGPTEVMRQEHAQMRELLARMQCALTVQDVPEYLGLSETLLILMQQHNLKEEQVLYRLADRALAAERPQLLARLAR